MIQLNWSEIISVVVNIILLAWSIYQLATSKKEEENTKSKVRIWQNQAEGVKNALLTIAQNPGQYSNKEDIARAVQATAQSAVALDKSFVEERFYTDQEIKTKREEAEKQFQLLLQRPTNYFARPSEEPTAQKKLNK